MTHPRHRPSKGMARIVDPNVILRLVFKVTVDSDGCWIWQGHTNKKGYGQIKIGRVAQWVHRVSYAAFVGEIDEGLTVHHHCHKSNCIRPECLTTVTVAVNSMESNGKGIIDSNGNYIPF